MFHKDKAAVDVVRVTITLATTAARVTPATREATVRLKSTTVQVWVFTMYYSDEHRNTYT